jgi:hypothetical protein
VAGPLVEREQELHGLRWPAVNLAPLVAVVDDVNWSDAASLRWLVYTARRLDGVPPALLLAARPAEEPLLDEPAVQRRRFADDLFGGAGSDRATVDRVDLPSADIDNVFAN